MEKKFSHHPVHLPFNCPLCNMDLNLGMGTDMRYCHHVQFIRMTGEGFDYFVYVDGLFGHNYIEGLKASDQYRKYLKEKNIREIDEATEQAFITGECASFSDMAAAVPYFEDIARHAALPGSAVFVEKRPYGSICFCLGGEAVNIQGK
ncbi:MAG: hypothetical protein JW943_15545 [Deltaproteobacteria bacterium]|nr:hypothetical protein [Deltaproteobacteria bacterium]